mgnify:CR=1 FL=1
MPGQDGVLQRHLRQFHRSSNAATSPWHPSRGESRERSRCSTRLRRAADNASLGRLRSSSPMLGQASRKSRTRRVRSTVSRARSITRPRRDSHQLRMRYHSHKRQPLYMVRPKLAAGEARWYVFTTQQQEFASAVEQFWVRSTARRQNSAKRSPTADAAVEQPGDTEKVRRSWLAWGVATRRILAVAARDGRGAHLSWRRPRAGWRRSSAYGTGLTRRADLPAPWRRAAEEGSTRQPVQRALRGDRPFRARCADRT